MTTVVIAREFRGQTLFLTSAEHGAFCWSCFKDRAMPVSVDVAKRIITEAQGYKADAYAIDKNDNVIVPRASGAGQPKRDGHTRLNLGSDLRPGQCAYICEQVPCENLAAPGDIYCEDCRGAVEDNAQESRT